MRSVNENRQRTKRLILLLPGIHLRSLQRLLHTSFNTTRYHVHNLQRDGEVTCSTDSGHSRLYAVGVEPEALAIYPILHKKTMRRILKAFSANRSLGIGELSRMTGVPRSTVSESLDALRKAGLVTRMVGSDSQAVYSIQNADFVNSRLEVFERNLLTVATENFIDLWDV